MSKDVSFKEHSVWEILIKECYTEDGQKDIECLYDFIQNIGRDLGYDKVKRFYDYWDRMSGETFYIFSNLVHKNKM